MENCAICGKILEKDKSIACKIFDGKRICLHCCFEVSTGNAELIQKIREEKHISKEEILETCRECMEKQK